MTIKKASRLLDYYRTAVDRLADALNEATNVVEAIMSELDNIDNYAARLEKYGEEDKAEGLLEASARIRNTMQKALDCPPEKEGE